MEGKTDTTSHITRHWIVHLLLVLDWENGVTEYNRRVEKERHF